MTPILMSFRRVISGQCTSLHKASMEVVDGLNSDGKPRDEFNRNLNKQVATIVAILNPLEVGNLAMNLMREGC